MWKTGLNVKEEKKFNTPFIYSALLRVGYILHGIVYLSSNWNENHTQTKRRVFRRHLTQLRRNPAGGRRI